MFRLAAARTQAAAEAFTLDRAADRLRVYLSQAVASDPPAAPAASGRPPLRVVIAGHDLKFFTPLIRYFKLQPDLEVRVDQWAALGEHDEGVSKELADWADVVICEWCGPNAVWYSRHKRRDARLLVHLHRFELYSHYPGQVKIGNVDQVICVSDHYARLTREHTGWPAAKVITVPNPLDVSQLDRPKLDGAWFHLGMISIVPSRKRLDLALDVLEELRRDDDRYLLYVKSRMPWEHWWVWQIPAEREHYSVALRRIQRSPLLRDAVVFDDAGPDVAAWLRRVGFVLSTSDDESFHVAPAEGMASRAVPVIRHWPGAETIYDQRWIRETPADLAAPRRRPRLRRAWRAAGEAAHEQAQAFELGAVCRAWHRLLTGEPAGRCGRAGSTSSRAPADDHPSAPLTGMFFTLAVSADTPGLCAELTDRARIADPAVMPIPGPAVVAWRSPDGRAALLHWGGAAGDEGGPPERGRGRRARPPATSSHAGTIWAEPPTPGSGRAPVVARTSVTRVDPVYVARGARRGDRLRPGDLGGLDRGPPRRPRPAARGCALLNPGFPLGSATPFSGVSALPRSTALHLVTGDLTSTPSPARRAGRRLRRDARGRPAVAAAWSRRSRRWPKPASPWSSA